MAQTYNEKLRITFDDNTVINTHIEGWNLNGLTTPTTSSRTDVTGRGKRRVLDPTEIKDTVVSWQNKWTNNGDVAGETGTDAFRERVEEYCTWDHFPFGDETGDTKYSARAFVQSVQRIAVSDIWHLNIVLETVSDVTLGTA